MYLAAKNHDVPKGEWMNIFRLSLKQFVLFGTLMFIPGAIVVGLFFGYLWAVSVAVVLVQFLVMLALFLACSVLVWMFAGARRSLIGVKIPVRTKGAELEMAGGNVPESVVSSAQTIGTVSEAIGAVAGADCDDPENTGEEADSQQGQEDSTTPPEEKKAEN